MGETTYFSAKSGKYRSSMYPGFTGGTTDSTGNVVETPYVNNISALTPETEETIATQTPEAKEPTLIESAAGMAVPAATTVFGESAGTAFGQGASIGESLSAGAEGVGNAISELFGGEAASKIGSRGGSVIAGGSDLGSSVAGSSFENISGNAAGEAAGSSAGSSFSGALGAGAGAGIGTFIGGLITGQDVGEAVNSGFGAAAGAAVGSAILPGVGTAIGAILGSLIGGSSIICHELFRQGIMPEYLFDKFYVMAYRDKILTVRHYRGYLWFARPYVSMMQKKGFIGKVFTKAALFLVREYIQHIKWQLSALGCKPSKIGKCVAQIGEPLCYFIGTFTNENPVESLAKHAKENLI